MNFKQILIIFLVALLGGFVGTIGANELYPQKTNQLTESNITYNTKESSNLKDGINRAIDSVVRIEVASKVESIFGQQSSTSLGSGVIVSQDGYIVTNDHVVEGGDEIIVYTNQNKEYKAKLIGTDPKTDIAVIKIEGNDFKYATISNSDAVEVGDETFAIGNPLGTGISVTSGIISALHKQVTINNESMSLLQTNAEINSGNSGGGLFNINGELIGIVNAKTSSKMSETTVEGLGYAIPSNTVLKISEALIEHGYVKNRPTLGVAVTQIPEDMQGFEEGLYITEIIKGGAAEKAKLQTYDRIVEFNNHEIESYTDLSACLSELSVGDTVDIVVIRNNEEVKTEVTLQANEQ